MEKPKGSKINSKHYEFISSQCNKVMDNFPLLADYEEQIKEFVIFHLIAIGVRYKNSEKVNFEEYLNNRKIETFDYHTSLHRFYKTSLKTMKIKEERSSKKTDVDIYDYYRELDILLPNEEQAETNSTKQIRTTAGQINRLNYSVITYDNFQAYESNMKMKIEEEFSNADDELEMPLHLYMFERGIRFHALKHFCTVLDRYTKKNKLPKTPTKENALMYIETLKIPSLKIVKEFISTSDFNPGDFEYAKQFRIQLTNCIKIILHASTNRLLSLYDEQHKYYLGKMQEYGELFRINQTDEKEKGKLGETESAGKNHLNYFLIEREKNFFKFVRAIVEFDDINLFDKETDEDNYLNDYERGKDFSANTFNKIKLHMQTIIKEENKNDKKRI